MQLIRCFTQPKQAFRLPPQSPHGQQLAALRAAGLIDAADVKTLSQGALSLYAGVFVDVVDKMAFATGLPHFAETDTGMQAIRDAYQKARAEQGTYIQRRADLTSPVLPENLLLGCFYDRLYKSLQANGDIDWTDEAALRDIDALARTMRKCLATHCARRGEKLSADTLSQNHAIADDLKVYRQLAARLGLPQHACPNLGARLCVEQYVRDAACAEYGIDPDNPLLLYMYDRERNYAAGLTCAWRHAISLMDRLQRDGVGRLTVSDIETLHAICVRHVRSTVDTPIDSRMGAKKVCYGLSEARGLTAAGKAERERFYADLNRAAAAIIKDRKLPEPAKPDLIDTVEFTYKNGIEGVGMFRELPYSGKAQNIALVRGLAQGYIDAFVTAIDEIGRQTSTEGLPEAERRKSEQLAVTRFLQSMERLHPFQDANGRIFEIVLPVVLLVALGQDACFPLDPYRFDGASCQEARESELQAGQDAFRACRDGGPLALPVSVSPGECILEEAPLPKAHALFPA